MPARHAGGGLDRLGDLALSRRCADLDDAAWTELLRRHRARVARLLWRSLSGTVAPDEIDDLCQDVFLRLLAHGRAALRRLRCERAFALAAFLSSTARRIALDELLRRRGISRREAGETELLELAAADDPEREVEAKQRRALFSRALLAIARGRQPARDHFILRAHFFEGLSASEIARRTAGLSEDGVETLLRRARARLLARLHQKMPRGKVTPRALAA